MLGFACGIRRLEVECKCEVLMGVFARQDEGSNQRHCRRYDGWAVRYVGVFFHLLSIVQIRTRIWIKRRTCNIGVNTRRRLPSMSELQKSSLASLLIQRLFMSASLLF